MCQSAACVTSGPSRFPPLLCVPGAEPHGLQAQLLAAGLGTGGDGRLEGGREEPGLSIPALHAPPWPWVQQEGPAPAVTRHALTLSLQLRGADGFLLVPVSLLFHSPLPTGLSPVKPVSFCFQYAALFPLSWLGLD